MTAEFRCDDCGFTSDNWRLFVRPLDGRADWKNKRICRCGWKCYRRTKLRECGGTGQETP